jgi:pyridoxamine 5'-phosphate oxidase
MGSGPAEQAREGEVGPAHRGDVEEGPAASVATRADLAAMRRHYGDLPLLVDELADDPLVQLAQWLDEAATAGVVEPNAMVLATAGAAGPDARTVLLKGIDERGLRFFTNLASAKVRQLTALPRAAVVFPWHSMSRQVRATGAVSALPAQESAAYFATRPRESQLGAWASRQSEVVGGRDELDTAYAVVAARFPGEVPCPPFWGGYVLAPETVELWVGRTGRLHDRVRYRRTGEGWTRERLAP